MQENGLKINSRIIKTDRYIYIFFSLFLNCMEINIQ